ncbi:MAG: Holliday junction branch migration protein RuvA [Actinomycetota bacterium]
MIELLSGSVAHIDEHGAVIDVNGVGYRVLLPTGSIASLPDIGRNVTVHTHLAVREDAMTLYGFSTAEERDVFEILIKLNKVGPKLALSVLSVHTPDALRKAVSDDDLAMLTQIPGIGKAIAEPMMIELRRKLGTSSTTSRSNGSRPGIADAREALTALGYSESEARDALNATSQENQTVEQMVRSALKYLGAARS